MHSHSGQRRQIKRLNRIEQMETEQKRAESARFLKKSQREVSRRANDLGAPAVWAWEADHRKLALALDSSGELAAELSRICAEAVARAAGRHLVGVSRPLADRSRMMIRPTSGSRS